MVAGTLHKNKCDAVEMEFQHLCTPVAKTVMQAGGQENETGKKGMGLFALKVIIKFRVFLLKH